jgi:hypothetical protein
MALVFPLFLSIASEKKRRSQKSQKLDESTRVRGTVVLQQAIQRLGAARTEMRELAHS